jgi:YggT family protein
MTQSVITAIVFVLNIVVGIYLLLILLRLFLPIVGANFHNQLAQGILKATSPLVIPVRRILPPLGRIDTATVVVAYGIQYLLLWLLAVIQGFPLGIVNLAVGAVFALLFTTIRLFTYAIIIRIIISWISPGNYNPAIELIGSLTEPVIRPFRRLLPPLGGFDLSAFIALVALGVIGILLGGVQQSVMEMLL